MSKEQNDKSGVAGKYRWKKYVPFENVADYEDPAKMAARMPIEVGPWIDNLVVAGTNHGLGLITKQLIGITTYPLEITQAKIGTGTTAPTNSDTNLQTPTLAGILRSTQSATATVATMEFFISNTDLPNGTYTEFGLFCGDQLFARSIISPSYSKATNEDSGFEYVITLSNT